MMKQRVFTLETPEMLSLWKLLGGYEPLNDDCSVECADGIDLDSMLIQRIRAWYAEQLLTAPVDALPIFDIADDVWIEKTPHGSIEVELNEGTVRVISVRMAGWQRPAIIVSDPQSPEATAQRNPFTRATSSAPVAIVNDSGSLSLYPAPDGEPRLRRLMAIVQPRPGIFLMTDALIDRIPRLEP